MDTTQPKTSTSDTKAVARHAINAFGSPPNVWRFGKEAEKLAIDVGGCGDRPCRSVISYTTIGLCEWPPVGLAAADNLPERFELAAACSATKQLFPHVLATAAFSIMREGRLVQPGDVIREVVREVYPRTTLPHLYLTQPLLWPGRLTELRLVTKRVAWLMAVPVSDVEIEFLRRQGDAFIATLYKEREIDMFDLDRTSWLG